MNPLFGVLDTKAPARVPFRWAGGKRWLAPSLVRATEGIAGEHVEPFAGGASLFFARQPDGAWLNDANSELMHAYTSIRDDPDAIADRLGELTNDEQTYYRVRDSAPADPASRAARFVFLNRTSFGGLWRVNRHGRYNVPYGNRLNAWVPGPEDLRLVAQALCEVRLTNLDFRHVLTSASQGTLVYLDPPYAPAAAPEIEFNRYTATPFRAIDHADLAALAVNAVQAGAHVFVSLSSRAIAGLYAADHFNAYRRNVRRGFGNGDGKQVDSTELLLTPKWCREIGPAWETIDLGDRQ